MKNKLHLMVFMLACALVVLTAGCRSNSYETAASNDPLAAADLLKQADLSYAQRADVTRVREAVVLLKRARAVDPNNYEVAWKLARTTYYLGTHTEDKAERDKAFEDGIKAGAAAVKLQANKPDGHFWFAANMGGRAEHSKLHGMADVGNIRQHMNTVLKLDEGYQAGSAYMALAQTELKTPKLVGGDPQKAVDILEKGLKYGAENSMFRLCLAEAYLAVKRKDEAKEQLDHILNMKPHPDYLPEYKDSADAARKLLEKRF
jgi:Tfp pilus assembly protein PilF